MTITADAAKALVGRAALDYVTPHTVIGVGTGSTVAHFVRALGETKIPLAGAVSTSSSTAALLREIGVAELDANDVESLDVYIDGADELDPRGAMIKGGGGALTREKIVASLSSRYVCIVDASKRVDVLGDFGVPVEIIPMAEAHVQRRFADQYGGAALLRTVPGGAPYVTDNGQHIIDVRGLHLSDPRAFEDEVSAWAGVVTCGVFAHQRASVALIGGAGGVQTVTF